MNIESLSVARAAQPLSRIGRTAQPTGIEKNLERGTFNGSVAQKLAERFGIVTTPPTAVELYAPRTENYVPPAPIDVRPDGAAARESAKAPEQEAAVGTTANKAKPSPDPQSPIGNRSATVASFTGIDRADEGGIDVVA